MHDKYGRIFTEADVREILRTEMTDGDIDIALEQLKSTLPANEPIFVIRAHDKLALEVLHHYRMLAVNGGASEALVTSVEEAAKAFQRFSTENPDSMKVPD